MSIDTVATSTLIASISGGLLGAIVTMLALLPIFIEIVRARADNYLVSQRTKQRIRRVILGILASAISSAISLVSAICAFVLPATLAKTRIGFLGVAGLLLFLALICLITVMIAIVCRSLNMI